MSDTFLVSVADAIGLDPSTGNALFYGTANINSAFTLSMGNTDVRAGKNNALRYKYMNSRDLAVNIEQATFEKTFMALNTGSSILNTTVNVVKTECVQLTAGVGTLSDAAIGDVNVFKEDGTIVQVTATGGGLTITVPSGAETKVTAVYRYSDTVDRLSINTTQPPNVITLILIADVRDNAGVLVEQLNIEIPSLQIDGNYELSFTADGVSTESLSGMALAVDGTTCNDGSTYGYVQWVPASGTDVSVAYIASTPANFEPTAATLSTQQITVNAIRGGVYQNTVVTADATYAIRAGGDADITVDSAGLITVANTSTAGDEAIVDISYDDGSTVHIDTVVVTVQA